MEAWIPIKDGISSKEELVPLAQVNVESLRESGYFTFVHFEGEDDKPLELKPPVDYWIDYDKSVLTLHCMPSAPGHGKTVLIRIIRR